MTALQAADIIPEQPRKVPETSRKVAEQSRKPADATEAQYALLRRQIIEGRFPPGTPLLETVLSAEHGVSRTPMREALHRLAQDGLIERSPRGFQVRVRTPEEIVGIYDARIALESTCASMAAIRRTEFDLARLTHLLAERRLCTDPVGFGKLNNAWHDALRTAAHNTTIQDLLERLDTLLELYRSRRSSGASDPCVEQHEGVLTAIRDRDADAAQVAMCDHVRILRDRRIANLLAENG